jgi:transcription-repair coupling factor (superfamily II helicase)
MRESQIEAVMRDFYSKKFQVMICSTIIESGLDVPNANTLIVLKSDRLGLAQLHQLRGRVGRSSRKAYAYLFVRNTDLLTAEAKKRLEALQRFVELGSGFHLASQDLEIRGGGNLLGAEQSGEILSVGFETYMRLLNEVLDDIPGQEKKGAASALKNHSEVKTFFSALLDPEYVVDDQERIRIYHRLSSAESFAAIDQIQAELLDRFGALPEATVGLIWVLKIRLLAAKYGIGKIQVQPRVAVFEATPEASRIEPSAAVRILAEKPKKYRVTENGKLIVEDIFETPESSFQKIRETLELFCPTATAELFRPSDEA